MEPNTFQGVWEDVVAQNAKTLRGCRVEVRVIEETREKVAKNTRKDWADFEARVRKISKGWRIPGGRLYSAEDFYESRE